MNGRKIVPVAGLEPDTDLVQQRLGTQDQEKVPYLYALYHLDDTTAQSQLDPIFLLDLTTRNDSNISGVMFPNRSLNFKSLSENLFPTPGISIKSRPAQSFILFSWSWSYLTQMMYSLVKRDVYTNSVPLINHISQIIVAIFYESPSHRVVICNLITDVTG